MKRVIWLVLDSFGIGNAPDAERFGDAGADTFGHIAASRPLRLPHMGALGLFEAYRINHGVLPPHLEAVTPLEGAFWGVAREASPNKDTLTGHWEMAGVPMDVPLRYFPDTQPTFPPEMIAQIVRRASQAGVAIEGFLGDRHASGVAIINTLGEEHIRTGKPIIYTSADSVIQIAAHEEHFGLERLYRLCAIAREVADAYGVGRVIARPFVGDADRGFTRTKNRRDYAMRPSGTSVLEIASAAGLPVVGVGKIPDIFGGHGITTARPAYKLEGLFNETLAQMDRLDRSGIIMTNFVDFDMEWGHRRDVEGYASGLEYFDTRLPELLARLRDDDLLILTADHGCDPTWSGSDHTRENVPIFGRLRSRPVGAIGVRESFADMGATVSDHLGIAHAKLGESFLT
jgi:phosphopentomutase